MPGSSGNILIDALTGQDINGTIYQYSWLNYGHDSNITYAFADIDGKGWTNEQKAAWQDAAAQWSNVANITFTEVAVTQNPDMAESWVDSQTMTDLTGDSWTGWHYFPNVSAALPSEGYLNIDHQILASGNLEQGGAGFRLIMHEIGHALGLFHPHGGITLPGVSSSSDLGTFDLNQQINTVMSYNSGILPNYYSYGAAGTPMALDIAAIQFLYGANMSYRTGDDVYYLPDTQGQGTYLESVWDAGGTDEFRYDGSMDATINLNDATLSLGLNAGGYGSFIYDSNGDPAVPGGYTIANGVIIENARGGSGDDHLYGNEYANKLFGGAGADTMAGGLGNDTIYVDNANDVILEAVGEGSNDRVATNTSYTLTSGSEIELFTTTSTGGTTNLKLTGNAFAQRIVGNAGNNVLSDGGAGGNDKLVGLGGNDTYIVYNTGTTIVESAGNGTNDRVASGVNFTLAADDDIELFTTTSSGGTTNLKLSGNALAQKIVGNAGNNVLSDGGAGGNDELVGLGGNDTYIVYNVGATIVESAGYGTNDRVAARVNFTLAADDDIELFTTTSTGGTTNLKLTGNALAQTIVGNAGNNVLSDGGAGGSDKLVGLGGNDTYIVYNTGATIVESAGNGTNDRVATNVNFTLAQNDDIELFTTTSSGGTKNINLTGNALSQKIVGNAGDNRIDGMEGSDIMYGLAGDDTFVFSTMLGISNVDTIIGYNVADDQIEIDDAIFDGLIGGPGTLSADNYHANTTGTAQDALDRIIYDTDSGELYYDADGNGTGAGIQFAQMSSGLALSNLDFEVI